MENNKNNCENCNISNAASLQQEAQLPQKDRATRYVMLVLCYISTKFVLCFTSYGSYECFKQQVTFNVIQGHWQWCHSIGHIRFPTSLTLQL